MGAPVWAWRASGSAFVAIEEPKCENMAGVSGGDQDDDDGGDGGDGDHGDSAKSGAQKRTDALAGWLAGLLMLADGDDDDDDGEHTKRPAA